MNYVFNMLNKNKNKNAVPEEDKGERSACAGEIRSADSGGGHLGLRSPVDRRWGLQRPTRVDPGQLSHR